MLVRFLLSKNNSDRSSEECCLYGVSLKRPPDLSAPFPPSRSRQGKDVARFSASDGNGTTWGGVSGLPDVWQGARKTN